MYATANDMMERFGEAEVVQLTDRASSDVAHQALADATAEIDIYLSNRYRLPLDPIAPVIRRVACDIARYRLYDNAAPEEVRRRYEDAIRLLKALADGTASLGLPGVVEPNGEAVVVSPGHKVFGRRPNGVFR
ncbi:MAG: DUF1320 domain-containing protein [Azonexus sp.]|jgi:phage gp36-like protein|nr:DUF1320 domain-containing protein [Azonexus sp.]